MPNRIEVLFNKFIDGSCSNHEFNELMQLLQENQHEEKVRQLLHQVYQTTARSLRSVTYVDDKGHLQTATEEQASHDSPHIPANRIRLPYRRLAIAASVAILLTVSAWWFLANNRTGGPATEMPLLTTVHKITHRGEMKYLLLPDSTQVWLNVASTLDFPESFDEGTREVYLNGEAYFDVQHAAERPFIIHTGKVQTRVLGTAFNIKAYHGQSDIVVSVKRGKVQVSKNGQLMATLTKGQEVKVANTLQEATIVPTKETNVAGWTTGKLQYDSRTVADIVQDLERTYNVVVQIKDESISSEVLTTSFRKDIGVQDALEIICKAVDRNLTYNQGTYYIDKK